MSFRIDSGLGAPAATPPEPPPAPALSAPAAPSEGPSAFARMLSTVGQAVDSGEGMMNGVASGQWSGSDPGTLIALQAGIYRYSEAVDMVGKLVDRAGNAVRTVLQGSH